MQKRVNEIKLKLSPEEIKHNIDQNISKLQDAVKMAQRCNRLWMTEMLPQQKEQIPFSIEAAAVQAAWREGGPHGSDGSYIYSPEAIIALNKAFGETN